MDENLTAILQSLQHEDASIRDDAMGQLHDYIDTASNELVDSNLSGHAAREAAAAAYIEVLQYPAIIQTLQAAIEDSEERVRSHAAILLSNVKMASAQDALIRHLRIDPVFHVRATCATGLRSSADTPDKLAALLEALQDPQPNVVFCACASLGEIGDRRVVEALRSVLFHADWNVRFVACDGLVALKAVDNNVIRVLEELIGQPGAESNDRAARDASKAAMLADQMYGISETREPPRTTQYVLELAKASRGSLDGMR